MRNPGTEKNPCDVIREQRKSLGYSDVYLSNEIGITVHQYSHLEDDRDELFMVITVGKMKKLCNLLNIRLRDLYGFNECEYEGDRKTIIADLRSKSKMSMTELSDRIGVEVAAVEAAEVDVGKINDWVMDPVIWLAKELGVSPACLLDI